MKEIGMYLGREDEAEDQREEKSALFQENANHQSNFKR